MQQFVVDVSVRSTLHTRQLNIRAGVLCSQENELSSDARASLPNGQCCIEATIARNTDKLDSESTSPQPLHTHSLLVTRTVYLCVIVATTVTKLHNIKTVNIWASLKKEREIDFYSSANPTDENLTSSEQPIVVEAKRCAKRTRKKKL